MVGLLVDPLSQGVLGAAAAQSAATRQHVLLAGICGLLAGLAPDLDSLIRSDTDPLIYLEYHRQFSHALIFIPFGGLACAALLQGFLRGRLRFRHTYLYCTTGYATHGLLDACTTYGTQLLWPFSDARIAWHTVSIIDPLFTGPIVLLVVIAVLRKRRWLGRAALLWAIIYLSFGAVQRERAEIVGAHLAAERGHAPLRLEAKPGFANLWLWKLVYETTDRYYVDAVRLAVSPQIFTGEAITKLKIERDLPWLDPESQQARDVERFRWFSNGYLAPHPTRPHFVIDIRYSLVPNELDALWGIQLDPAAGPNAHVRFQSARQITPAKMQAFRSMLFD